ncbi:hypothetical protein [Streptomyces sp. Tu 2975]|uniref:hypothetical protein n=1 Tax=Streptomyces sp. Tu 2975 TaxID=2676871 RepID=UPI001ABDB9F6|nr:hypothetical protein [Streptomyces sp. Tu 2975]
MTHFIAPLLDPPGRLPCRGSKATAIATTPETVDVAMPGQGWNETAELKPAQ